MVLTNGEIEDIKETINACVRAAVQPMSIILVVLNRNNYVKLRSLECTRQNPLYSADLNNFADNIHLVEFEDFVNDTKLLTQKTLAVVPTQIVNYFRGQGIEPDHLFEDELMEMTQRLKDTDFFDEKNQDPYFEQQKDQFIQLLCNFGLQEDQVRQFLQEKGAYCADSTLVAHCINMGRQYEQPSNF